MGEPGDKLVVATDPKLAQALSVLAGPPPVLPSVARGAKEKTDLPQKGQVPGGADEFISGLGLNGKTITTGPFTGLYKDKCSGRGSNKVNGYTFSPDKLRAIGNTFYPANNGGFDHKKTYVVDDETGDPTGNAYICLDTADKATNDAALKALDDKCPLGDGKEEKAECDAIKKTFLAAEHTHGFWEDHAGTFYVFGLMIPAVALVGGALWKGPALLASWRGRPSVVARTEGQAARVVATEVRTAGAAERLAAVGARVEETAAVVVVREVAALESLEARAASRLPSVAKVAGLLIVAGLALFGGPRDVSAAELPNEPGYLGGSHPEGAKVPAASATSHNPFADVLGE